MLYAALIYLGFLTTRLARLPSLCIASEKIADGPFKS